MPALVWLMVASGALQGGTALPTAPLAGPRLDTVAPVLVDSGQRRPRAVEYSQFYSVRLTIHRYASFATVRSSSTR